MDLSSVAVDDCIDIRPGSRLAAGRPIISKTIYSQLGVKRGLDIFVSLITLVMLSPLLAVIAVLIKLETPGPILFRQPRWGKEGRKFLVLKFRSMKMEFSDYDGVAQTIENDPRVTRIGRFLRRSNLDELPQLINVLLGDMSLVGPRCHAIGMKAAGLNYEELVPEYHDRHAVRPGMTGLAQMRGLRGPTHSAAKSRARIACDLYYIRNYSLLLDLKIIWGTIRHEIFGGNGF
jgi:lipopolysaccharide/colanic/teichoic acid biosynthesis glycosyltransferase